MLAYATTTSPTDPDLGYLLTPDVEAPLSEEPVCVVFFVTVSVPLELPVAVVEPLVEVPVEEPVVVAAVSDEAVVEAAMVEVSSTN